MFRFVVFGLRQRYILHKFTSSNFSKIFIYLAVRHLESCKCIQVNIFIKYLKRKQNVLQEYGRKRCFGWNLYVSAYYKNNLQIVWLLLTDIIFGCVWNWICILTPALKFISTVACLLVVGSWTHVASLKQGLYFGITSLICSFNIF